jgi:hypothetical protein
MRNKKFWEELISCFVSYATDCTEDEKWRYIDTDHSDLISLLLFFQNKEPRLKNKMKRHYKQNFPTWVNNIAYNE